MPSKTEVENPIRNAIVTGGSQRIGAAIVASLVEAGFNVAIHHASSSQEAQSLADSLQHHGCKIVCVAADLTSQRQTSDMFDAARQQLGPITLLVNNASAFLADSAERLEEEIWDTHFDVHLKAPALLSSLVCQQAEIKSGQNSGLIVNLIDQRVLRPNPNFFSYTLSKSALWTATQTMAQAFAPHLRVNAIGPGPTLPNQRQSQRDFDRQVAGLLMKQGPKLEEFGRTICYLWDTPSITGQMIALDGGQHLAWQTPDIAGIRE